MHTGESYIITVHIINIYMLQKMPNSNVSGSLQPGYSSALSCNSSPVVNAV